MLKNVTLKIEESLLKKAKIKALKEHKTLSELFGERLLCYVSIPTQGRSGEYQALIKSLSHVHAGRGFSRTEMNKR